MIRATAAFGRLHYVIIQPMPYRKPRRLRSGDKVAILSPSWGGPNACPRVYENGLKVLHEWGLKILEYPTTRATADFLSANPQARADSLNEAFADPSVTAIIASIGGDDSVRVLPFLDRQAIARNPKIVMGYSDTTTLLVYGNLQGFVTFHGPSIMAGFSQMESLPKQFQSHVREMLFDPKSRYQYQAYDAYSDGYPEWGIEENLGKVHEPKPAEGWRFLQGSGRVTGELFGGCIEVLEFLNGTQFWPPTDFWAGKILFFETSEEKPSPARVKRILRNYGVQGLFDKVAAVLVGRARNYTTEEKEALDKAVRCVVSDEFGRRQLPIVTNMDFGHTDPQWILPLGVRAELDCHSRRFGLVESWLE
jgi:muramoyltetrapeptide carboxypeptidase LdcA involved in peptidoglycan recycling